MDEINSKTKIELYTALGVVPILVTLGISIAMINFKADAAEKRLDRQAEVIREQREILIEIREQLAAVRSTLEFIKEHHK